MRYRRRPKFWLVVAGTTAFLTIEPALFLVLVAVGLSAVAVVWTVMLARALLAEAFAPEPIEPTAEGVCPLRGWWTRERDLSSSVRPTSSDRGVFS